MVQTPEQYQFIYAALVEHILFGNTEFEADDLNNVMEENLTQLPGGVNGFSHQVSIIRFYTEKFFVRNQSNKGYDIAYLLCPNHGPVQLSFETLKLI